jgi:hypothetical protein
MTDQPLALAVPAFDTLPPEEVQAFAKTNMEIALSEADTVKQLIKQASQRAWLVGRACVHLRDNVLRYEQQEIWEDWAKQNISENYLPLSRAMRWARIDESKVPGRTAAQGKQLLIMLGEEPSPKQTPRKSDVMRFTNFKASCSSIQRWWREGEAIKGMDADTLSEILDDLKPVVAIAQAVHVAVMNEESEG